MAKRHRLYADSRQIHIVCNTTAPLYMCVTVVCCANIKVSEYINLLLEVFSSFVTDHVLKLLLSVKFQDI